MGKECLSKFVILDWPGLLKPKQFKKIITPKVRMKTVWKNTSTNCVYNKVVKINTLVRLKIFNPNRFLTVLVPQIYHLRIILAHRIRFLSAKTLLFQLKSKVKSLFIQFKISLMSERVKLMSANPTKEIKRKRN